MIDCVAKLTQTMALWYSLVSIRAVREPHEFIAANCNRLFKYDYILAFYVVLCTLSMSVYNLN